MFLLSSFLRPQGAPARGDPEPGGDEGTDAPHHGVSNVFDEITVRDVGLAADLAKELLEVDVKTSRGMRHGCNELLLINNLQLLDVVVELRCSLLRAHNVDRDANVAVTDHVCDGEVDEVALALQPQLSVDT